MAIPGADVLPLIPTVLTLEMTIIQGGGWTLGLTVTDVNGAPVTLTGTTASITLPDGTVWTATTSGSLYSWDIPKATVDTALGHFSSGTATLAVSDGVHTTVWAKGKVTVL